ncbi:50S ribosomal protein L11 methyltransferase [Verrucomicrobiota bacterium]
MNETGYGAEGAVLTLLVAETDSEMVCDWIREQFEVEPVMIQKPREAKLFVDVYLDGVIEAELAGKAIQEALGLTEWSVNEYRARDWQEAWKHHFSAMDIGKHLRICPPWEAGQAEDDRQEIVINPGLSFGTGNHFTTNFCLETVDELSDEVESPTFADIGTGSGILAIAAAKLGWRNIIGVDYDMECMKQSALNAEENGVSDQCEFGFCDITRGWDRGVYDVVCANIISGVLMQAAETLYDLTGKFLILAGIREVEADAVSDCFVRLGGKEIMRDGDGEWAGILIMKG